MSLKVLYLSNFRDLTGWGRAGLDNILALDSVGVDVVCRPLVFTNDFTPPKRILELEAKSSKNCDVVIQHALPHQMDFHGAFKKNIGIYATETSHFQNSSWADRLNTMSEVWVINAQMVDAARRSGVNIPLHVIPHASDMSRFQRRYDTLDLVKPYKDSGDFLFYFVGEYNVRKSVSSLIQAFHLEFDPSESVQLVIKSNKPGMSPLELYKHIEADCTKLKNGMKLFKNLEDYKKEIIITDRLSDQGMMKLHASCDCFVMPSKGEAWAIPAFDAMAMGKTPIVPKSTGFLDYMNDDCGWMVDVNETPVWGVQETFNDLFVGNETWWSVDIQNLRRCMREAFEQDSKREEKAANGIERAYDFSYQNVGLKMAKLLA